MSDEVLARVYRFGLDEMDIGSAVATIGVFDGLHVGHRELIADLLVDASFRGLPSVVITFDPDPDEVIDVRSAAPRLVSHEDRIEMLARTGVDAVVVVPFSESVADADPCDFLDEVVASILDPVAIHVGEDFRFGYRASGGVAVLSEWMRARDGVVFPYPLHTVGGSPVTATRVRALIARGAVDEASVLLGRAHSVSGFVRRGRGEGRVIGFPTANVHQDHNVLLPAEGVYAGTVGFAGRIQPAAISVGVPPTFPDAKDYLEAHLLDFDEDLYDMHVVVSFVTRLRDQKTFGSFKALSEGISRDVAHVREVLGSN